MSPVMEANVRKQILEGKPKAQPMPMPGFADKLKAEQVGRLIQYLKTL
jgi:mono/diheme cytochrome c family protein